MEKKPRQFWINFESIFQVHSKDPQYVEVERPFSVAWKDSNGENFSHTYVFE